MALDFFRTNATADDSFIRGAGRLLWAGITVSFPTKLETVINMSTYDAQSNWYDLGATKGGIQISHNNTEESYDVDQIQGDIYSAPTGYEVSVGTTLAEMTLERYQIAFQGSSVTTDSTPGSGSEKQLGVGNPSTYIQRRLAVLQQRASGKIRGYFFRIAQKMPQEATLQFNKTGEQQTVPVRFKCLPDASIADVESRFFIIRDQV